MADDCEKCKEFQAKLAGLEVSVEGLNRTIQRQQLEMAEIEGSANQTMMEKDSIIRSSSDQLVQLRSILRDLKTKEIVAMRNALNPPKPDTK